VSLPTSNTFHDQDVTFSSIPFVDDFIILLAFFKYKSTITTRLIGGGYKGFPLSRPESFIQASSFL